MAELTVERLFGNPPLTGTLPTQLKFAPDGSYVAYLQTARDDRERLDLWRVDLESGERECWINARDLIAPDPLLSAAEKAERERKRLFSSGITHYEISPDGSRLLIPASGVGYLFEVKTASLTAFTPENTRQTDFHFSPRGNYVSYVRAGDLYVYELTSGQERAVTTDGGGLISNGIADFIAQEEMHRFEGHWWSMDEARLAFTRTDESSVAETLRSEIDADAFKVVEQRYPYAGADNATVDLFVFTLTSGESVEVNYRHNADDYLARVNWSGQRLATQVQSRDQQRLWLDFHLPGSDARQTLLEEQSPTWINLHDNFQPVDAERFLWTSERSGTSQIYLYSSGEATRLTHGAGRVEKILHADQQQVVYCGWEESPTEQHVYALPLTGGTPSRWSGAAGWHDAVVDSAGKRFIDRWSSLDNMGKILVVDPTAQTEDLCVADDDSAPAHPYQAIRGNHRTPEIGTLEAEDGQSLYYRLTRPAESASQAPLIVYVYGGPGVNRVRNEWAPLLLQLFAGQGFAVLELDNRGSANRGRSFEAPIHGQLGKVEVRDQLLGARFAQSLPWVDAQRIGVFGHSYGGYMTLMCLAQAPEVFKAGVSVAPVSLWELYDTHYTERFLGTPQANPEGYQNSSIFPYLSAIRGKLLIMHGMADDNVLFTHSTRLFKALQSRRTPFEMMTYPGAKHALQEQDVAIHRFDTILDFFRRNL